jgi:hypothetical protein
MLSPAALSQPSSGGTTRTFHVQADELAAKTGQPTKHKKAKHTAKAANLNIDAEPRPTKVRMTISSPAARFSTTPCFITTLNTACQSYNKFRA